MIFKKNRTQIAKIYIEKVNGIKTAKIEWKEKFVDKATLIEKLIILDVLTQGQVRFHENLHQNLIKHFDNIIAKNEI